MRKVVLAKPGVVRIADERLASDDHSQALVRLVTAGVCGSDLSAYRGTSPNVSYPRVLGHEVLVEVLRSPGRPELEGRRAVLDPMIPCRSCRACNAGRHNCCVNLRVMGVHVDGGLQQERLVDPRQLVAVPPGMPDDVAVLAEPLTIAYHAVRRGNVQAGETCVVFGAGTIGLLIAQLLTRARGCRALIVDLDVHRLEVAQTMGAIPLHGDGSERIEQVEEATGGDMADAVFEASGSTTATQATTSIVGHAGRIVLVGWNRGPVEIDTVTLMRKEADLVPSRNSLNAFPAALRLLADGLIDVRPTR